VRINRSDTLAGVPLVAVRDFLRRFHVLGWARDDLRHAFPTQWEALFEALRDEGYVRESEDRRDQYETTPKGGALTKALAGRPLRRATAEHALAGFIGRCGAVRDDPGFIYRVRRAILFGSMLTDAASVGDVDLAVAFAPKLANRDEHHRAVDEQIEDAKIAGRRFSNLVVELDYPRRRVEVFLKSHSHALQFTTMDDGVLKTAAQRVVYEDL